MPIPKESQPNSTPTEQVQDSGFVKVIDVVAVVDSPTAPKEGRILENGQETWYLNSNHGQDNGWTV